MGHQRAHWNLAADARSVPQARALVARSLTGLADEPLDVVLLLTSELVTNAVLHGEGPVGVRVARESGQVRVEVADQSPTWPVVQPTRHEALSGRGLLIVEGLSSSWGVIAGDTGKTVWFRLDT